MDFSPAAPSSHPRPPGRGNRKRLCCHKGLPPCDHRFVVGIFAFAPVVFDVIPLGLSVTTMARTLRRRVCCRQGCLGQEGHFPVRDMLD